MTNRFSENLRLLASKFNQKTIAKQTGFSCASVNNYIAGTSEPSISFLIALKNAFGIDIDDFLFREYYAKDLIASEKFLGNYIVYYYNNTSYKGEVHNNIYSTLNYGVLSIYRDGSSNIKACATFLKSKKDILGLIKSLKNDIDENSIAQKHKEFNNFYMGSLYNNSQNIFVRLNSDLNEDECFMIFNNPPSNDEYIGGIGTINSVSRGREHNPCVQLVLISKRLIDMPDGEIYNCLQLDIPIIEFSKSVKSVIDLVQRLYINKDSITTHLTDTQKEAIVENNIKYLFNEIVEGNMFRFSKVSNREDDHVYKILKEGIDIE